MRAVNLLPRDEQRERREETRTPLVVLAGGLAAVTAVAVVLSFGASGAATDRREELAFTESAIALLPKASEPTIFGGTLAQERADRVAALSAALSSRVSFDRLFREISYVLPEDAWLTGMTASLPVSAVPASTSPGGAPPTSTPAGTDEVTIQGATYSHDAVARVLGRLSVIPSLENVRLVASARVEPPAMAAPQESKARRKTIVTFSVAATLRTGGSS